MNIEATLPDITDKDTVIISAVESIFFLNSSLLFLSLDNILPYFSLSLIILFTSLCTAALFSVNLFRLFLLITMPYHRLIFLVILLVMIDHSSF